MIITDKAQIKIAELRESNNLRLSGSDELECYELIESDLKLPADATFTRSSVAYLSDGTQVPANSPRFEQGRFGKAIMVEEGTTNLLTANQSDVETDTSGFGYYQCTLSRDTSLSWHGSACLKATANGGAQFGPFVTTANASVVAGENVTASAYVRKGQGDYRVRIAIEWKDSSGQMIGSVRGTHTSLTEHWQRLTVTGTAPAGTDRVTITVYTDTPGVAGDYFYVDGWQVEKKAYPTSWVPGGTTRSAETLTIPTAGVLNSSAFTIEMRIKQSIVTTSAFSHGGRLLDLGQGLWLWNFSPAWPDPEGKNRRIIADFGQDASGTRQYLDLVSQTPFSTVNFEYFAVTFDGTTFRFYRNGSLWGSKTPSKINPFTQIVLGGAGWIIDDLRISSIARSDEEIAAAYQSGQPLPVDEWTTYKLDFDDKVRITTQGQIICNELIEI